MEHRAWWKRIAVATVTISHHRVGGRCLPADRRGRGHRGHRRVVRSGEPATAARRRTSTTLPPPTEPPSTRTPATTGPGSSGSSSTPAAGPASARGAATAARCSTCRPPPTASSSSAVCHRNDARQQFRLAGLGRRLRASDQPRQRRQGHLRDRRPPTIPRGASTTHRRQHRRTAVRPWRPRPPEPSPGPDQRGGPTVAAVPQRQLLPRHHHVELDDHDAPLPHARPGSRPPPTRSCSTSPAARRLLQHVGAGVPLINNRWYLYHVAGQNVSDYNPTQRLHVLESAGTDPMEPYASRPTSAPTRSSTPASSGR